MQNNTVNIKMDFTAALFLGLACVCAAQEYNPPNG
jgi:hypothetical protein